MQAYVMDAFTTELFSGNQAGIVLPESPLPEPLMQAIAAEFKHSETAFVSLSEGSIRLRFFTPQGEVPLCGHATIAAFSLLKQLQLIPLGRQQAITSAGCLNVTVAPDIVWLEMASARFLKELPGSEWEAIYGSYGLSIQDRPLRLTPQIISTGLKDIILPVRDLEALRQASQDTAAVTQLSRRLQVVGVHMFCLSSDGYTAHCSNFAPLYGIPEECATGTANAALTYYLYRYGLIAADAENSFLQGEHMSRPCTVRSRLSPATNGSVQIQIGGSAIMSMACELQL